MKEFKQKHKHHIRLWLLLMIVVAISGYYTFKTPQEDKVQNIENKTEETITSTDKTEVTSYKLQVTEDNIETQTGLKDVDEQQTDLTENFTTLTVNDEEYKLNIPENSTVYEMMQLLTASSIKPFIFKTKEFTGLGHFVESINGVKNDGKTGKYWIYYINGESAQVGISNYIIQKEDKIEWKYEKSNM